jgi:hypothetical protein
MNFFFWIIANSFFNYRKKTGSLKRPWRVCRWRWRIEKGVAYCMQVVKGFRREAKTGTRTRSRRIVNSTGRTERCWRQSQTLLRAERDSSCCNGPVYELWTGAVAGGFAKWSSMLGKDSGLVMSPPSCLISVENKCMPFGTLIWLYMSASKWEPVFLLNGVNA